MQAEIPIKQLLNSRKLQPQFTTKPGSTTYIGRHLSLKLFELNCYILGIFLKGKPLLEKAGAQTDFSFVPRHSGKFQRYRCAVKWIKPSKLFLKSSGGPKRSVSSLGLNPLISFEKCTFKETNKCSFFRLHFFTLLTYKSAANLSTCT